MPQLPVLHREPSETVRNFERFGLGIVQLLLDMPANNEKSSRGGSYAFRPQSFR